MSISISCPVCLRPYRLKDKFAGKRVKCRDCGNEFAVPGVVPPPTERSRSGTAVYRHQLRESEPEIALEATPFLPDIERHIERTVGPAPLVFHELVSPEVHIDLHVVPPTGQPPSEDRPLGTNHYTVVTSGLSSRPMNLPAKSSTRLRYAELMIALPGDWPGMNPDGTWDDELMKDETHWWPFRWLKSIARLPHEYGTFIAHGHTIPNGDPAEAYSRTTRLCCMLVLPSLLAPQSRQLIINDDIVINFYALWPIYLEEMNLKLQRGLDPLIDKFDAAEVTELIQINRKNTCKRGWWPFPR